MRLSSASSLARPGGLKAVALATGLQSGNGERIERLQAASERLRGLAFSAFVAWIWLEAVAYASNGE